MMKQQENGKFNDKNIESLSKELGGLEKELGAGSIPKSLNNTNSTKVNSTKVKPAATVAFSSVPCCPGNCKICGHSGAFLTRSRKAKVVSDVTFGSVDLFHSLVREFAVHPDSVNFEASCLDHVKATLES